ncbi:hypothetical protein SEPCBS119000_005797 [Sporothrix epigloea]|uniref:Uncharacterized protein n=1 Tax=Sporothrix epigloea TaxID=1892477 RepID=A0ABP0DZH7_9PEZI
MDATESGSLAPERSAEPSLADILLDPSALVMLLATILGFVLPMLWIYPPVAPRPSDFLNETHSRLGLDTDDLVNVEAARAPSTLATKDKPDGQLNSVWIHPIASCPGIQIGCSRALPTGLDVDRLFTFAQLQSRFPARAGTMVQSSGNQDNDEDGDGASKEELENWKAINQHQFPRLASLQVELWCPDLTKIRRMRDNLRPDERAAREPLMSGLYVLVRYPWQAAGWLGRWDWLAAKLLRGWRAEPEVEVVLPVALPTTSDIEPHTAVKHGRVQFSGRSVRAVDLSAELPRSLQLYLGVSNRLGLLRVDAEPEPLHSLSESSMPADKFTGQPGEEGPESFVQPSQI